MRIRAQTVLALLAASSSLQAQVMASGQVFEAPGQVFKVVFKQPASKDFAKTVADTLQSAWEAYNRDFQRSDGKAPMAWLSPANRMEVQIVTIGGGVNAQYKSLSWNGYIQVDPGIGEKDLPGLRITLCHELFHGLQDAYANMAVFGRVAHWWFEATAEWAGLKYGSPYTAVEAREEMARYRYFLSVPPQESEAYEEKLMAYAFCMMVEFAEIKSPGYVRRALNGGSVSSRAFYEELAKAAGFPANFPEYVGSYLKVGFPNPGLKPAARIHDFEGETRIYRNLTLEPGALENPVPERIADPKAREAVLHFPAQAALQPLTARLYTVANGAKEPRGLRITLKQPTLQGVQASDRAVVLKVPKGGAKPAWTRLAGGNQTVKGLGSELDMIVVAVFNPDPWLEMDYDLELALEKNPVVGAEFLLDPLAFETKDATGKEWKEGPTGASPTSKWRIEPEGAWFDSSLDGFHLEAAWTKPPATLKQGDSFTLDITLTADGPRAAQLQISPVGPMSEWELEALAPGPGITKPGFNTWLISIPAGKGRRTASLRMKVSLPGPWRSVNLATGEGSGGRRPISVDLLPLVLNVNNLARIQWAYVKKGARRWWDKK